MNDDDIQLEDECVKLTIILTHWLFMMGSFSTFKNNSSFMMQPTVDHHNLNISFIYIKCVKLEYFNFHFNVCIRFITCSSLYITSRISILPSLLSSYASIKHSLSSANIVSVTTQNKCDKFLLVSFFLIQNKPRVQCRLH